MFADNNFKQKLDGRLESIDVAKGIGIIMVVIGHLVKYNSLIGLYIYSYDMPLFFMISGICFNKNKYNNLADYVKTRIKLHLYPAILFTLFIAVFSNILLKPNSAYHLQDFLKGFPHALWLLGVLFMTEIIYFYLNKVLNVNTLFIIAVTIPLGFLLATPGKVHLPYEMQAVPLALLFYTIGCRWGFYIKQKCCDNIRGGRNISFIYYCSYHRYMQH